MIKPGFPLSTWIKSQVNRIQPLLGTSMDRCALCLAPAQDLCADCRRDLPRNDPACRRCGLPLISRHSALCGRCLAHSPPQDDCRVPWRYEFPVNTMITQYKYSGHRAYGRALALAWCESPETGGGACPDLLLPCPISPERLRERGFNQAAEIARWLGRQQGIRVREDLLKRRPGTRVQTELNRRERLKNLTHAFELKGKVPEHVALVDDVITTGATVQAMATCLRKGGARRIDVWALARTP